MSAIVYFEIHYDEAERARKFYSELLGWKIERNPGTEYWTISTQDGSHGGMMKRFNPNQKITDYFGVQSILESSAKVEKLRGRILVPKMAVPKEDFFALCMDSEGTSLASGRMILKLNNWVGLGHALQSSLPISYWSWYPKIGQLPCRNPQYLKRFQ